MLRQKNKSPLFAVLISAILVVFCSRNYMTLDATIHDPVKPDKSAVRQWELFQYRFPESEIQWDEQTGNCRTLSFFTDKHTGDSVEEIARKFLASFTTLFGMDKNLTGLGLKKIEKVSVNGKTGIEYVRFTQSYNDFPVVGTETLLHITESGVVFRVFNHFYSKIKPSNKQKISSGKAIDVAKNHLKDSVSIPSEDRAMMVIYPAGKKFYYVWEVIVGQWQYYIDAENGKIFEAIDTPYYQREGKGKVYIENFCKTPNPAIVRLPNLYPNGRLDGVHFFISTRKQFAQDIWDIRDYSGQELADWTVYNALKGLLRDATFHDFARNALDVVNARIGDVDLWIQKFALLFAGIKMKDIFCAHGIDPGKKYAGCP